jgi:hypothetical protein
MPRGPASITGALACPMRGAVGIAVNCLETLTADWNRYRLDEEGVNRRTIFVDTGFLGTNRWLPPYTSSLTTFPRTRRLAIRGWAKKTMTSCASPSPARPEVRRSARSGADLSKPPGYAGGPRQPAGVHVRPHAVGELGPLRLQRARTPACPPGPAASPGLERSCEQPGRGPGRQMTVPVRRVCCARCHSHRVRPGDFRT